VITVLFGLEVDVEVSAFGVGGEESCVLLCGHIEVLIDLSTFSKFQFQYLLFRSIADAGDIAGIDRNSLHALLDANEPREDRGNRTKSGHAHKQDIGAATRRSPKWTVLPPS